MTVDYISWEAFATLFTGVLAVVAAFVVGLRQQKITERQTEFERQRLRYDLYDRRYKIYDRTRSVLGQILFPRSHIDADAYFEFREVIRGAKFVFDDDMGRFLDLIWVSIDQTTTHLDDGRIVRVTDLLVDGKRHFDRLEQSWSEMDERFAPWLSLTAIR